MYLTNISNGKMMIFVTKLFRPSFQKDRIQDNKKITLCVLSSESSSDFSSSPYLMSDIQKNPKSELSKLDKYISSLIFQNYYSSFTFQQTQICFQIWIQIFQVHQVSLNYHLLHLLHLLQIPYFQHIAKHDFHPNQCHQKF